MIKKYYSWMAAGLYGNPSKDFFVVGVTWTNGKTTTSQLIHAIFNKLIGKTLVVTTEWVYIGNEKISMKKKMTSYDPYTLQKLFATAKENWCKIAVIEVSSHGIHQYRFQGVEFDMAVLTNIAEEHLDYHWSLDEYAKTKKQLFQWVLHNKKNNKLAVFPKDDKFGREWNDDMTFDRSETFGMGSASLQADNLQLSATGTSFDLHYLGKVIPVTTKLLGWYNVLNVLAAMSASQLISLRLEDVISVIREFEAPSWRMQSHTSNGVHYFVDYAHNADGLQKALQFLHSIKWNGRLLLMFGLPGERGDVQMPLWGEYADRYADFIVLTEDDSGEDNRLEIMNKILQWLQRKEGDNFYIIPERSLAMDFIVKEAKEGDLVLFAGQWHQKKLYSHYGVRKRNDMEELHKRL